MSVLASALGGDMSLSSHVAKIVAVGGLTVGSLLIGVGPASAHSGWDGHHSTTLVVSTHQLQPSFSGGQQRADHRGGEHGRGEHGRGNDCRHAAYTTIGAAVVAANPGDTIVVCPGTYPEEVQLSKPVSLEGKAATINVAGLGLANGIIITSSHVSVSGFTVTGALGEGIVAEPAGVLINPAPPTDPSQVMVPITDVSIEHNIVDANDLGDQNTHQCSETPSPPLFLYPGDCGGGIHLNTVAGSEVRSNQVTNNSDGILVTDDYGPTYGNVIAENYVAHNIYECGIVLPSHNSFAATITPDPANFGFTYLPATPTPATGGVFNNVVTHNVVLDNGTNPAPPAFGGGGSGSGIGVFAPAPGTASYNNLIADNFVSGSGQSGFTIHAHYQGGEYVSGNKVVDNTFGPNNLLGDGLDGPSTDPDFTTTAILVFSAVHVDMVIAANHIYGNAIGIWLSANVSAAGLSSNVISGATTNLYYSLKPIAFTGPTLGPPTSTTSTVGVLINPNGLSTTYYVEFGLTTAYGSVSVTANAGSGLGPSALPVNLTYPLAPPGTTYHYQVVATNSSGTTLGGDQTFTTP